MHGYIEMIFGSIKLGATQVSEENRGAFWG